MNRIASGLAVSLLAVSLLGMAGCGGASTGAFTATYPDNDAAALGAVLARVAQAPAPSDAAVAIALGEDTLSAWDLATGRTVWTSPVSSPRTAPHLAGRLVVLHEGERIVARHLADGRRAFDVADDRLSLVGAGGEGEVAAIVLSTTGGVGAESRVLITRGASIAHRFEVEGSVGAPDVRAGLVFVPWGNQNLSVIDAESGMEVARMRSLAGVVSHARAVGGGLYFGQAGVGRMSADPSGDAESVGWYAPAWRELPGAPPPWRSAYEPPAAAESATHRIRFVWTPRDDASGVAFTDDTVYVTFYRFVFALSPEDLAVRWVYAHTADVVGASAREGGVMIADAMGELAFLGADDGRPRWGASMGTEARVVVLRLGGFAPSGAPEGEVRSLADQLLVAAQDTDARLVPARAFAVRALAAQPEPEVTARLIVLCDDASLPAPLREAGCEALASRENGNDAVLAALGRHASFLEERRAPPVGPLARAAARMREARAVPLLVAHLDDPETPEGALVPLAEALAALGDDAATEPLLDFVWLYHAEAATEGLARGLAAAARAAIALGDTEAREAVQSVVDAPFTAPTARGLLSELLEELRAADLAREQAEAAAAAGAEAEGADAEPEAPAEDAE